MARKKRFKNYYPAARVHHLTLYMSDQNGYLVHTKDRIQSAIEAHQGAWSSYAFILHDADRYDAEAVYQHKEKNHKTFIERLRILSDAAGLASDETQESGFIYSEELSNKAQAYADMQFPPIEKDQLKPAHWHVILTFSGPRHVDEIARWFGLEPNWSEAKTGRGAAESAWAYLIHAHDSKKAQYSSDSVYASFDYVNKINEQLRLELQHESYHVETDIINDTIDAVCNGLPLIEAKARLGFVTYIRNQRYFEQARADYVLNRMPMPLWREIFYVSSAGIDEDHGKGGLGKTACAHALAKQIAAQEYGADTASSYDDMQINHYIYEAGDAKVFLQNYDGEPILVINEINGTDFKRACKGVNGVKEMLEPFPTRKAFDKKHGAVICCAKYIIINGIQSFEAFKKELAKPMKIDGVQQESEESVKEQFDRRFWGHIKIIDASQVQFWINRGLFDNCPGEQSIMQLVCNARGSFGRINQNFGGAALSTMEHKLLSPVLSEIERSQLTHQLSDKITDPDLIPEEFLTCYGVIDEETFRMQQDSAYMDEPIEDDSAYDYAPCSNPHDRYEVYNKICDMLPKSGNAPCWECEIKDLGSLLNALDIIQLAIDIRFDGVEDNVLDEDYRTIMMLAWDAIDKMS